MLARHSPATSTAWGDAASELLGLGIHALQQQVTPAQRRQFRSYGELLLKWNSTYNLLGATTAQAIVQDHLLDSLAVHPVVTRCLPPGERLVDVGTGAGLPGIVLAIMDPQRPFLLVEPIGKKAAFLRQVVAVCRLPNVQVLEARIEDLQRGSASATGPHFICRAFASLKDYLQLCLPFASGHSLFLAMKAARVAEELRDLDSTIELVAVEALHTAARDVERNLVIMRPRRRAVPETPWSP